MRLRFLATLTFAILCILPLAVAGSHGPVEQPDGSMLIEHAAQTPSSQPPLDTSWYSGGVLYTTRTPHDGRESEGNHRWSHGTDVAEDQQDFPPDPSPPSTPGSAATTSPMTATAPDEANTGVGSLP